MVDDIYKALMEKGSVDIEHQGIIIVDGSLHTTQRFNKLEGLTDLGHRHIDDFLAMHKEHNGNENCLILNHIKQGGRVHRYVLVSAKADHEDVRNYLPNMFPSGTKIRGYIKRAIGHSARDHTTYKK